MAEFHPIGIPEIRTLVRQHHRYPLRGPHDYRILHGDVLAILFRRVRESELEGVDLHHAELLDHALEKLIAVKHHPELAPGLRSLAESARSTQRHARQIDKNLEFPIERTRVAALKDALHFSRNSANILEAISAGILDVPAVAITNMRPYRDALRANRRLTSAILYDKSADFMRARARTLANLETVLDELPASVVSSTLKKRKMRRLTGGKLYYRGRNPPID